MVEGTKSRVEGTKSRVEGNMSWVEGTKSRVQSRGFLEKNIKSKNKIYRNMVTVSGVLNYFYVLTIWLTYLYFQFTVHTRPRVCQMRNVTSQNKVCGVQG